MKANHRLWWHRVVSKLITEFRLEEVLAVQSLRYRRNHIRMELPIIHNRLDERLIRAVTIMAETPRLDGEEYDTLQTKAGRFDLLVKCLRIDSPFFAS
jgi:hypothetical protein